LDIGNFLQSTGDSVSRILVPNSIFRDLISIKIVIGLIAISLLISSSALPAINEAVGNGCGSNG
jgi:hypothetical protein